MKRRYNILIIIVILNMAISGNIQAQNDIRIQSDFKKIEIYLLKIWELVRQFNDSKALEYITLAKSELDIARELLFRDDPRYLLARISMTKAKQYIDLAARRVLSRPFINLKAQLDDLIIKAENATAGSLSDEVHYLLNQAKKYRRLAYTAFSDSRMARGEEYFRISFFFARKCIDYVNSGGTDLYEEFKNLEMSVRQLLAQTEELLADKDADQWNSLLREAESQFEESLAMADKGRLQMAINRLKLIKRLLYRIFDQAERGLISDEDRLKTSLYSLSSFLDALESEIENSADEKLQTLLDKARQLYREAEQDYENKNFRKSLSKISLSERFANRVFRMTRSRDLLNVNDLEDQLRETQNILSLQEARITDSSNKNIVYLYQEANQMLERAESALSSQNTVVAFQLIQAATRMSARIQRELRNAASVYDQTSLENKYQQIMNSLDNLENNDEINRRYKAILNQMRSFAERGKQYLDQGNYLLADEYFSTAWEQINSYTDKWRN